ncbi:MAG TPA: cupredoxin domain-containing protein [Candidatus Limnocylindria bacterium]|nr:cupredoxin domain-containing protein [Candidatus Limnocylindria bacterium]
MRKLTVAAFLILATVVLAGCAAAAAAPAAGGTVNATLTDMKISVDRTTVKAGTVTFAVRNAGAVVHELVVIRTDVAQDKIPMDSAEPGKVDETGNVGETGEMAVGASKTFSVTLPAGHYVLMCNEIGHYASGMHVAFTVD